MTRDQRERLDQMPKTSNKPAPRKKPSSKDALKQAVKEALAENPDLLNEAVAEALEDMGMAKAIREGLKSGKATREEVVRVLRRRS
jgi:hypothetical protein